MRTIIIFVTLILTALTLFCPRLVYGLATDVDDINNFWTFLTPALASEKDEGQKLVFTVAPPKPEAPKEEIKLLPAVYEETFIDRSGFDHIYRKAEKQFNVSWEVLSAVHFVESRRAGNSAVRSYAGAQGPMQFIPSTFRHYGVDGDGDGQKQITDVNDAIYSAANLLSANGGDGNITHALYRYNHSTAYVNRVLSIARSLGY